MELRTLTLRNYRVFESLELEVPAGLVGIYGPNGSGKSTLLEAMTWALYGRARTPKQGIATSGSVGECVVELGFFHDEHHYVIRRTISGVNHTVKARVTTAGQTVADGPTEVGRYVRSLLGMGEQAFRSSVFAEQKQLAAFSDNTTDQRRRLVLSLLGITPIEKARDDARTDARAAENDFKRLSTALPDVDELIARRSEVDRIVEQQQADTERAQGALDAATAKRRLLAEQRAISDESRRRDELIREHGRAVRRDRDRAAARLTALDAEEAEIAALTERFVRLTATAANHDAPSQARRLAAVVALLTATKRAQSLHPSIDATVNAPDAKPLFEATEAKADASAQVAVALAGEGAAKRDRQSAERRVAAASSLTDEGPCPTCGQEIGGGAAGVVAHFVAERDAAENALKAATAVLERARKAEREAARALESARTSHTRSEAAWEQQRKANAALAAAADVVEQARTSYRESGGTSTELDQVALANEAEQLQAREAEMVAARQELDQLVGRRVRLNALAKERLEATGDLAQADEQRTALLAELGALGFDAAAYDALVAQAGAVEQAADAALDVARRAEAGLNSSVREQAALIGRIEQVAEQRGRLQTLAGRAVLLGRTGELLNGFRQAVVATIGPRLSAQASELFLALTGGDYDGLTIDPDTYEIQVIDQGVAYSTTRFSGSEVDLANLALRVAISEQIRFQAGGQIGLLVLDEALASLDGDRRDRMLTALTQLAARFRQILVVTHAVEVKEQLPQAIEVLKLGPRRSTARLVGSQY